MEPTSPITSLPVDADETPDLTNVLQQATRQVIGNGSFGIVWHCLCASSTEVAVKAITFPRSIDQSEKAEFLRKMKRELGIWRRLDHPNIVPLLGKAQGGIFGTAHPCMVSVWMPHGTLYEYANQDETLLPLPTRIKLIKGTAAGLEYLHSMSVVHGDLHPGNILIDSDHNPRLTDFGFSQTLSRQDQLTYLWTDSIRPGAVMWVAPELLYPELFSNLNVEATLNADVYSLGSIILFILSGKFPWKKAEVESQLEQLKSPPRPQWPVIPDVVWNLIERCWSPKCPTDRPSAQEVLSFSRDRLEQLLQPNPTSDINVVLFGALGCGKSSIINLLAGKPIAPVSTNMEPCTRRPRCYRISISGRQFRFWDTTGFHIPREGTISPLSPYEQAHTVLRNLPGGVHLILLCTRKEGINSSLQSLYWLINEFFFGGRAPVVFVVTHPDIPDKKWWERHQRAIKGKTNIPVRSIPRACITMTQAGCGQSRKTLMSLLENYSTSVTPVPLRLDLSSHETASHALSTNCGIDGAALMDKFSSPRNSPNVVLFGKGKSSILDLLAGHPVSPVSSDIESCTLYSGSHTVDTPTKQFIIWDTMDFNEVRNGHDMSRQAVVNAVRLIRDLLAETGIDLLVFVKDCGKLTASELQCYRLVEEFLCNGQVPVAVIVTHLEGHEAMDQWWETNGEGLLRDLSGNVIGHACITSLASHDPKDTKFRANVSESRLTVQALFEDCFSCPNGEGVSVQLRTKDGEATNGVPEMTVGNLVNHCGLTKELAKEVIKLYNE